MLAAEQCFSSRLIAEQNRQTLPVYSQHLYSFQLTTKFLLPFSTCCFSNENSLLSNSCPPKHCLSLCSSSSAIVQLLTFFFNVIFYVICKLWMWSHVRVRESQAEVATKNCSCSCFFCCLLLGFNLVKLNLKKYTN